MTSVLALRIPHAWTQAACSSVQGEGKPFLLPASRDGGFAVSVQTSGEAVGLPAPDSPATLVALVHSHTVAVEGTDATPVSTTSTKRDGATHDTDWDPFYNPAPKYGKGCSDDPGSDDSGSGEHGHRIEMVHTNTHNLSLVPCTTKQAFPYSGAGL